MFNYITENKDWLFSGAGIAFITFAISFLSKRKSTEIPEFRHSEQRDEIDSVQSAYPDDLTEVKKVAERFRTVLELMNAGRTWSQFTIPQLAQLMKLHKISELESVFTGQVEPSFSFIDEFCNTFGVSRQWLIEGKGNPYSNDLPLMSSPMAYLPIIEETNPESVYFVRANTDVAPAFILLKVSKWKYLILNRTWHISDVVGGGGRRQLHSFYALVKELRDRREMHTICWGITLEEDEFCSLICGEVFPGKYTDSGFSEDPWWDDLTDIYHSYPIAEHYEEWHGRSFIKAQEIIRSYISGQNANQSCEEARGTGLDVCPADNKQDAHGRMFE